MSVYQQPYQKITRQNGEIVQATDHDKQEEQLAALTDIIGPYDIGGLSSIAARLTSLEGGGGGGGGGGTGPTGPTGPTGAGVTGPTGATGPAGSGTPQQDNITPGSNILGNAADTDVVGTLSASPTAIKGVMLSLNGVLQAQGAGQVYTLHGSGNRTILWQTTSGTAPALATTDQLIVVYTS